MSESKIDEMLFGIILENKGCFGAAYEQTNSGVSLGKTSQGLCGQPQETGSWIRAWRQALGAYHPKHLQQRRPPPSFQQRCSGNKVDFELLKGCVIV